MVKVKAHTRRAPKVYTDEEIENLPNKWQIQYWENGRWEADMDYPFKDGAVEDAKFWANGRKWRVVRI